MKAIIIFSKNDILRSILDTEFKEHLLNQIKNQEGIIKNIEELNRDMMLEIFSPLLTTILFTSNNQVLSIKCQDGIQILFRYFYGLTYVLIEKTTSQHISENVLKYLLQRKIVVLSKIIKFLHGPIANNNVKAGQIYWVTVEEMYNLSNQFINNELNFKMEAFEIDRFNQENYQNLLKKLFFIFKKVEINLVKSYLLQLSAHQLKISLISSYSDSTLCIENVDLQNLILLILSLKMKPKDVQGQVIFFEEREYIPHKIFIFCIDKDLFLVFLSQFPYLYNPDSLIYLQSSIDIFSNFSVEKQTKSSLLSICQVHHNKFRRILNEVAKKLKKFSSIVDIIKSLNETWLNIEEICLKWKNSKNSDEKSIEANVKSKLEFYFDQICKLCSITYINLFELLKSSLEKNSLEVLKASKIIQKYLAENFKNLSINIQSFPDQSTFLNQYPGLINFILLDRTRHTILAHNLNSFISTDTQMFLEYIEEVHSNLIQLKGKRKSFEKNSNSLNSYYHELFFVDDKRIILNLDAKINKISSKGSEKWILNNFFAFLIGKIKQSNKKNITCYELFSSHNSGKPTTVIEKERSFLFNSFI